MNLGCQIGFWEVLTSLITALKQIFYIDEKDANQGATPSDHLELVHTIKEVLSAARQLWDKVDLTESEPVSDPYPNKWCVPPVGISAKRLVQQNLKEYSIRTFQVKESHADVKLCLPGDPEEHKDGRHKWYAKVQRTTLLKSCTDGTPVVTAYFYEYADLSWTEMEDAKPFNNAVEKMAPDVRLFCLLKTEANMGVKIGWRGIMDALTSGVEMSLINQEGLQKYRKHMIEKSYRQMKAEGMAADMTADVELAAENRLKRDLCGLIRPKHVMASLAELSIIEMRPLWKEFWDLEED